MWRQLRNNVSVFPGEREGCGIVIVFVVVVVVVVVVVLVVVLTVRQNPEERTLTNFPVCIFSFSDKP